MTLSTRRKRLDQALRPTDMKRLLAASATVLALAGCQSGSSQSGTEPLSRTDYKPPPVYGEQCPANSGSDTASAAQVRLTNQSPQPKVTVPAGRAFAVRVSSDRADVTEPQSYDPKTVCRLSVSLHGRTGIAMFLAVRPGTTRIAATITGIAGGLEHPAYGADITAR